MKLETAEDLQPEQVAGGLSEEIIVDPEPEPVKCEDKSTQNDNQFSAKVCAIFYAKFS